MPIKKGFHSHWHVQALQLVSIQAVIVDQDTQPPAQFTLVVATKACIHDSEEGDNSRQGQNYIKNGFFWIKVQQDHTMFEGKI